MIGTSSKHIISWDVIAVVAYSAVILSFQWIGLPSPVRVVIVAPALLFLPGFALSTVLFPGQPIKQGPVSQAKSYSPESDYRFETKSVTGDGVSRLGIVERSALSIGLSVGLLPLFALGFDLVLDRVVGPILVTTAVFSAVMITIGGIRRSQVAEIDRFEIPIRRWFDDFSTAVTDESPELAMVNIVLAVSIVLALFAVGIAFAIPNQGATFTEFAVGTEQEGEFVTDEYPEALAVGEGAEMAILIENHEGKPIEYHVVARFERVEDGEVTAIEEAGRFTVTVDSGETVIENYEITRSMTGEDIRLRFLLYREEPQTNLGNEPAYRSVHVWMSDE